MMNKTPAFLLIVFIPCFFSCISLLENTSFKKRHYDYEYKSFAKKIDFSSGDWLLTSITSTSYGMNESTSYTILKDFLGSKLGNRLKISNQLKDENHKYLIPFDVDFDNLKDEFANLRKVSNCDYVISAKIFYLDDTREFGVDKFNKPKSLKNSQYKSACKISFVVYDLKTENEIFNLDCLGYIWVDYENEGKLNIYQTSKSASADVMKRITRKIR